MPPGARSHDDIEALAATGDREAWAALVARHDRRVVVTLLARGLPLDRARDVAQETWARLWEQHRGGKLERLELPGLAVRQAAFLATDEARRSTRIARDIEASTDATEEVADAAAGPDERLATREGLARALAELGRMPPRAREVFVAVYERPEASHAETAQRLGLSVQRLRQTLCEVRARLRAAMESDDG